MQCIFANRRNYGYMHNATVRMHIFVGHRIKVMHTITRNAIQLFNRQDVGIGIFILSLCTTPKGGICLEQFRLQANLFSFTHKSSEFV
jgi:hypothetical protein